uniref:Complement C1q-like protein 2 n=1 Tax=Seriola lalandi dorsalis TaxID=1841481 RepID=A0A3B4X9L4_SERLL
MEFRASLLLTLLGFLFVKPGFGQSSDMDIRDTIEKLIKNLQDKLKDVETRQNDFEALEARLNATVDELTRQKAEMEISLVRDSHLLILSIYYLYNIYNFFLPTAAPQIAFSVSLANFGEIYRGPCTDKTLVFKRILSNTGNAYDQNTGIFTAPVNGLYYFSFSSYGYNTHIVGAILMKNAVRQISTYDDPSVDGSDSSSNAVVLQLAAGDTVHMELWDNGRVFDNLNGHTTFSGFLLFPM